MGGGKQIMIVRRVTANKDFVWEVVSKEVLHTEEILNG